jgi:rhamnopyranosyl-N-acetylglucosaminyl-diphospho-decaprenol beta-1,3/1,4-galactofuranosyltransferase
MLQTISSDISHRNELRRTASARFGDMNICAVVVTYNRHDLLEKCLLSLLRQSYAPAKIMIIDNASTEPAADVLRHYSDRVRFIRLNHNTGGAGGFYTGLKTAMADGYDAAWLMDDDGAPDQDCLQVLVERGLKMGPAILNPLVINEADEGQLAFGLQIKDRLLTHVRDVPAVNSASGVLDGAINAFNGTLIPRRVYEVLGDIKAECFIWGDEIEYCARAIAAGIPLVTCVGSVHRHPLYRGTLVDLGTFGKVRICPPDRAHFHYRNFGYYASKYRSLFYMTAKFLVYAAYLCAKVSRAEALRFARYFVDGATDRYSLEPSRSALMRKLRDV